MNPNAARLLDMINVLSTLRELAEMTTFDEFKKTLAAAEQQYRRWLDRQDMTGGLKGVQAHYCPDWDHLLIEPDDPEAQACTCKALPEEEEGDDS